MIRPVGEYVAVEPITEDMSPGGIVLPQKAQDNKAYHKGRVLSVGKGLPTIDGSRRVPPEVEIGEIILYRFGEDIIVGGETCELVREKDIIAVVEQTQARDSAPSSDS